MYVFTQKYCVFSRIVLTYFCVQLLRIKALLVSRSEVPRHGTGLCDICFASCFFVSASCECSEDQEPVRIVCCRHSWDEMEGMFECLETGKCKLVVRITNELNVLWVAALKCRRIIVSAFFFLSTQTFFFNTNT